MRLILGSASARRHALLEQIEVRADEVRAADIDETPLKSEPPRQYCQRIAKEKAQALSISEGDVILTGDTTVALGRRILGKPDDAEMARQFLQSLSGRRHQVITAIAVRSADRMWMRDVVTKVKFKRLSADDIDTYLDSGEWQGKAGGYAIQGRAAAFIPWISGSYSGVVGLPLAETKALLTAAGFFGPREPR